MQTKIEVLKNSKVSGNVVMLPAVQLDRKLYQEVAKSLEGIGGKWNKKHGGFLFDKDPSELLEEIATGVKRNLKQETQFFETPVDVAEFMVNELHYQSGMSLLEPSAGKGALIDAFLKEHEHKAGLDFFYIEKDADRNRFLRDKYKSRANFYHIHPLNDDFLELDKSITESGTSKFDRILANPPFSKNQDIDHVLKMWEHLKPRGRIVSVTSTHWTFASGKKETAFREWLNEVDVTTYPLDSGRFKKSGTMVSAQIVVIDKPAN